VREVPGSIPGIPQKFQVWACHSTAEPLRDDPFLPGSIPGIPHCGKMEKWWACHSTAESLRDDLFLAGLIPGIPPKFQVWACRSTAEPLTGFLFCRCRVGCHSQAPPVSPCGSVPQAWWCALAGAEYAIYCLLEFVRCV